MSSALPWRKRSASMNEQEDGSPVKGHAQMFVKKNHLSVEDPGGKSSKKMVKGDVRKRTNTISTPDRKYIIPRKPPVKSAAFVVREDSIPVDRLEQERRMSPNSSIFDLDRDDEDEGVEGSKKEEGSLIRTVIVEDANFGYSQLLKVHSCYDAVPVNNKLVVFDTSLPVKKAFFALIYNCVRSALISDITTSEFVGILAITDFIQILLAFHKKSQLMRGEERRSKEVEKGLEEYEIGSWRQILDTKGFVRPLITLDANQSLFMATETLTSSGIHRLPILDPESKNPLYILNYKRLLKFIWIIGQRLPRPPCLKKTPKELELGSWGSDITVVYPDTPLIQCLELFVDKKISGIPIISRSRPGVVVDMYTRFDSIEIAAQRWFDRLESLTVEDGLNHRRHNDDFEGVVRCLVTDSLFYVIDKVVSAEVHRICIVDEEDHLMGLLTMSNIIRFLVLNNCQKNPPSKDSDATMRSESNISMSSMIADEKM